MNEESTIKPVVAVVGRPNVGKSTPVNRTLGRREAVMQDVPDVTRDRISYDANQNGREFVLVDTDGWVSDARGMAQQIVEQVGLAISMTDAVLLVVDTTTDTLDEDEAVVKVPRRSRKPVVLAANKVDDQRREAMAAAMWDLGLGEPYPVSVIHGQGSGDLLDAVLAALPEAPRESFDEVGGPRRVAIVGKPNVGKSSLLNKLAQQQRTVVSDVSGTVVDPVDEIVEIGGTVYRLIDITDIHKRVREASGREFYASLRTQTAIERAKVCVVVIDASTPVINQGLRILMNVEETGRAPVITFNKWGLTDEERRRYLKREMERDLVAFRRAPTVNISALTGRNIDKLSKAAETAAKDWETRVSTGKLSSFLGYLAASHPHLVRSDKQPRILFGTQTHNCLPTFALFISGQLDTTYVRSIKRRLHEEFGFVGSPIYMEIRTREKHRNRRWTTRPASRGRAETTGPGKTETSSPLAGRS